MQTLFSKFHSHCVPHTFGLVKTKLNLLNNYFDSNSEHLPHSRSVLFFLNRLANHSSKNNEIITIVNSN